jgi:hypothetical protein
MDEWADAKTIRALHADRTGAEQKLYLILTG